MRPKLQDTPELSDAQLADMANQLDGALGEPAQRHRHRCANFAFILRHADEAEEETQNAWSTALRESDQFQRRRCRQRHSIPTGDCAKVLTVGGPAC